MLKVALVNMPFALAQAPSIALAQLQSVLRTGFPDSVDCRTFYINHDFARELGMEKYDILASLRDTVTGMGDWFFRKVAFPELDDVSSSYLARYSNHFQDCPGVVEALKKRRDGLEAFLDELIDRHSLDDYDVVGMTSMFVQSMSSIALARRLKARNPEVITLMGGANCETAMGQVFARNVDVIDFVFSGPALKSFPELVGHVLAGEKEKCYSIRGVFSRQKLATLGASDLKELGQDLDIDVEVPLDYEEYLASVEANALDLKGMAIFFETSRGCWWGERSHCTFCGLNGVTMNYRAMKPEKALALFESLYDKYYPRFLRFSSVDNILPREYLTDVFPKLEAREGAKVFYEVKADLKEREMEVLAAAGVTLIQPGIESLSTPVLKLMKKGTTAFNNIKFLKNCVTYGIEPSWNLLVGFPGEEEDVYEKYLVDLPLLTHLPPPMGAFEVRFDRYSPYFMMAKEYGLELEPYDYYEMIYPFDRKDIANMAYFFVDLNYEASYMEYVGTWLPRLRELTDAWNGKWQEGDRQLKPELRFDWKDGERVVYDSRSGRVIEHRLSDVDHQLLDLLEKPMKPARIARALDVSDDVLEKALASLHARQLVFQENDLHMSLIVKQKTDEVFLSELSTGAVESQVSAP